MQPNSRASDKRLAAIYESWAKDRARRRDSFIADGTEEELDRIRKHNFRIQVLEPRKAALDHLREAGTSIPTADKVALLVTLELSRVDASALVERLRAQLKQDAKAKYFSPTNLADNCGCHCGCCCAALERLPYEERILWHRQLKPFSIDPFGESGISADEKDALLVSDFLASYRRVEETVSAVDSQGMPVS